MAVNRKMIPKVIDEWRVSSLTLTFRDDHPYNISRSLVIGTVTCQPEVVSSDARFDRITGARFFCHKLPFTLTERKQSDDLML